MVEIAGINDRESLEAWLKTQPQKTSVAIAHRAAMRVLPAYWHWVLTSESAQKHDLTALSILRCNMISGVAAFYPTPEIRAEVKAASASADASAASTFSASAAASGFRATMWQTLRADCLDLLEDRPLDQVKLWRDANNIFEENWQQIKTRLDADLIDWSFWIKWYEASLNGEPLNPDMLERIALIDPKDWEQGPKHVNEIIAGIEVEFASDIQGNPTTTKGILKRNANVIEAQLDVLVLLATDEIHRIHGPNNITEVESQQIAARVSWLNSIIASVEKIKEALANNQSQSNALVVVDEQLSQITECAESLAKNDSESIISEPILTMGLTIKYLIECGAPGYVASGVAAFEYVKKAIAELFKRKPKNT
ncbi:MAG: hypothetical protein V3V13_10140 [Paracoccaceae bacterium]